jgi:hypothetical protein
MKLPRITPISIVSTVNGASDMEQMDFHDETELRQECVAMAVQMNLGMAASAFPTTIKQVLDNAQAIYDWIKAGEQCGRIG